MKLLVANDPRLSDSADESSDGAPCLPPKRARKRNGRSLCTMTAHELGYSQEQFNQFQYLCDRYSSMTMDDLRDACKKNGQIIKGTKKDLVFRCADGKLLGALPHCPNCGQGHMRFDPKYRFFFCPGHLSVFGIENCGMKIRPEDLVRTQWVD